MLWRAGSVLKSDTLSSWAALFVRVGGLAVLLPVVLVKLKSEEALVWQMLATITAMTLWFDFGISPTFSRIVAHARGQTGVSSIEPNGGPQFALGEILGTQKHIYLVVVVVALVTTAGLGGWAMSGPIGGMAEPARGWICFAAVLASATLTLYNGYQVSIITGFNRIHITKNIDAICGFMQFTATSFAALITEDLLIIVCVYSVWSLAIFILNRRAFRSVLGSVNIESGLSQRVMKFVWPQVWRSGIGIIMSVGLIQGSALIVPQMTSTGVATSYLLGLRLVSTAALFSQAPFYSKLPLLAQLRGAGDGKQLVELAGQSFGLALWAYCAGALFIVFAGQPALISIGSSVLLPDFTIVFLMVLAFFFERYAAMNLQLHSLGNEIIWHVVNGLTGIAMLLLSLLFWPVLSLSALPLSMLMSYALVAALISSHASARTLNIRRVAFDVRFVAGPLLLLIAGLAAASFITRHFET